MAVNNQLWRKSLDSATFDEARKAELKIMLTATLEELENRHQVLERELADALKHKSVDDLLIADLKRQKLRIKERIEKLKKATT